MHAKLEPRSGNHGIRGPSASLPERSRSPAPEGAYLASGGAAWIFGQVPVLEDPVAPSARPVSTAADALFESSFTHDFSRVPLHAGSEATRCAEAICGRAGPQLLQARLTIGPSDDPLEREADRIAAQVSAAADVGAAWGSKPSSAANAIQRLCRGCEEDEQRHLQTRRAAVSNTQGGEQAGHEVETVLRSPGQALDPATQSFFEQRMGYDFSAVRIHADAAAAESARGIGALAYTVGPHIVLGASINPTNSTSERQLFAHELVHTIQQGASEPLGLPLALNVADPQPSSQPPSVGRIQRQEMIGPEIGPELGPGFSPEFTPEIGPEFGPEVGPELGPEFDPDLAPDLGPELGPDIAPEAPTEVLPEPGPSIGPEPFPPVLPVPQPETHAPEDEKPEPQCGSPELPRSNVTFSPGPLGQGRRVKASPLSKCPGNTVGSLPDPAIYAAQFACMRSAGERGYWVRAHILHGRTTSSGPFNLHGPGNDIRNLIITDHSLNQTMRQGAEGPAITEVYAGNHVLWYESFVDSYVPGLEFFAQSITVNFGPYNTATGTEGPRTGGGTFSLGRTPPNCPATTPHGPGGPAAGVAPAVGGTKPPTVPSENLSFASSFKMCRHVLRTRDFRVADGGLRVKLGAAWFDAADGTPQRPRDCPVTEYEVTLYRNGIIVDQQILQPVSVQVGRIVKLPWRKLKSDTYYLEISTENDNPHCCLIGDIVVTTFPAPPEHRYFGRPNTIA